ncbi:MULTISPECIES: Mce protein [Mycobacterium]|uniref:Mce protein n=1 Tax=Mycobacterium kiyosense TaxID=2871094 RepID=A0A9P3Q784_9MYCO|nr:MULTISPECIES: Mce protein [Mycobacterium]BDB41726.1 hypothetical protein IWGMT90018_21720 [Mycobacterium kiyosense]BDE14981.1 hypothetical protein MKCMC460_38410 [Mycobacterium sp. 20KCMC460]GLB83655.1 hypothetical protein SRL2020028_29110 [Mycobacterium kiyosense]GLB87757.1 hypothetical protein SRL2020130_05740 [Mycobacterium kiyosense]GLB97131.1 hypothetical protein SRL2020226_39070 [Mycobacterium kiyosense]
MTDEPSDHAGATGDTDDTGESGQAPQVTDADVEQPDAETSARRRLWRVPNPLGRLTHAGRALVASGLVVAALAGLTGWLGYRGYERHQARVQRQLFIQTARQGAVNLTTLNYTEIDADVQRILDSATGAFRDDFEHRAKPFIELVKAAQSKSEGTVTEAGLESQQGDSARVMVAVAVKSRTAAGEEAPREWRMRIEVQAVGNDVKMSNVVFVP